MKVKRTLAVVKARNREFYRDKAGLGWNLVMPLLMILGFAFLFSGGPEAPLFTDVALNFPETVITTQAYTDSSPEVRVALPRISFPAL